MPIEQKVNILMVDDEPANLEALEAILEPLGQNLYRASSGTEALRCVLDRDYAVILLDVQMPDISGIETAALIRERERSRTTPIIFLTGVVKTSEMIFKGYSAGAVDYLMKPVVSGILRAKVEVFVDLAVARLKLQDEVIERARIAAEIAKLNMTLEQRNEDLIAANEDLEAFGHSVSHDLRMPLRHIHAYISMLEMTTAAKLDNEELRQFAVIRDAARRMGQLIDDLLAFSRIGRTELKSTSINCETLVEQVIADMQTDLADRHIVWTIQALPGIEGDANLLRQVWANLLANAVKYTRPREQAQIKVAGVTQDDEVIFSVTDNGVGFDPAYADRLFGVFQRLHSEKQFEGTGVGLANVRRIVQRHGGRTWADAKPDEGATFYFSLPLHRRPRSLKERNEVADAASDLARTAQSQRRSDAPSS
ncbi:MAG TPA: ATP-binding protein [Steroidobacteraceae bacterium]|nr:ATP-binding protein [Steroidobacteraceae bacterium]